MTNTTDKKVDFTTELKIDNGFRIGENIPDAIDVGDIEAKLTALLGDMLKININPNNELETIPSEDFPNKYSIVLSDSGKKRIKKEFLFKQVQIFIEEELEKEFEFKKTIDLISRYNEKIPENLKDKLCINFCEKLLIDNLDKMDNFINSHESYLIKLYKERSSKIREAFLVEEGKKKDFLLKQDEYKSIRDYTSLEDILKKFPNFPESIDFDVVDLNTISLEKEDSIFVEPIKENISVKTKEKKGGDENESEKKFLSQFLKGSYIFALLGTLFSPIAGVDSGGSENKIDHPSPYSGVVYGKFGKPDFNSIFPHEKQEIIKHSIKESVIVFLLKKIKLDFEMGKDIYVGKDEKLRNLFNIYLVNGIKNEFVSILGEEYLDIEYDFTFNEYDGGYSYSVDVMGYIHKFDISKEELLVDQKFKRKMIKGSMEKLLTIFIDDLDGINEIKLLLKNNKQYLDFLIINHLRDKFLDDFNTSTKYSYPEKEFKLIFEIKKNTLIYTIIFNGEEYNITKEL